MFKESTIENLIITDFEEAAESIGLCYVNDEEPGFRRRRAGQGFIYLDYNDNKVDDPKLLERLESLVIPPAWENVWISRKRNGHIQVTGKDAKGRKQYIYHPQWNEARNNNKFTTMIKFGESLPLIRERVDQDLQIKSFTKEKVTAVIVKLLEHTLIRIGNTEYVKQNGSFGLTTLRDKHIEVTGSTIRFRFKGKSGKLWEVDVNNKRLARLVKMCQELPGQHLFQYIDEDGNYQSVSSNDVNNYLKSIVDFDFTAKDFRTWGGTIITAVELYYSGPCETGKECKKKITTAIKNVSIALNNTVAVCRKYYVHPEIINSYINGTLFKEMEKVEKIYVPQPYGLEKEEIVVMNILREKIMSS